MALDDACDQVADTVEILSDMNGLLASFQNLGPSSEADGNEDLRVITSVGEASVPRGVKIEK